MIMRYFYTFLFLFVISACSQSSSDDNSSAKTELEGVWKRCESYPDQTYGKIMKFSGNKYTFTSLIYLDSNCTTVEDVWFESTRTFKIGDEITTDSGLTAKEIDVIDSDGETRLDIYLIESNNLFLGGNINGDAVMEGRPTDLHFEAVYEKQG